MSVSASLISTHISYISISTINLTGIGNGVGNRIYGVDDDTTTISNSMSAVGVSDHADKTTRRSRHSKTSKETEETESSDDTDTDTPVDVSTYMNIMRVEM